MSDDRDDEAGARAPDTGARDEGEVRPGAAKADAPKTDAVTSDDAKSEVKTEAAREAKTEAVRDAEADDAKVDGAKTDDAKTDGAKTDDAKTDDAKTDAKTDDAKADAAGDDAEGAKSDEAKAAAEADAVGPDVALEEGGVTEAEIEAELDERPTRSLTPSEPSPAPEPGKVRVRLSGATDVGRVREHNEDNFVVADLDTHKREEDPTNRTYMLGGRGVLMAVCDGMGGALAGEVASQMAIDVIHGIVQDGADTDDPDRFAQTIVASIQEAGARIFLAAKTNRNQHGMGTTASVAGVFGKDLFVGQVGDSRAYLLRNGVLRQITKDQSLVSKLIEAGRLTEEQAESYEHAHIILQALGTSDTVSVDLSHVELREGDAVMLCSDGLSGLATHEQIREAMMTSEDTRQCCERLIEMACDAGGHDNVTCIVARFDGALEPADPREETPGYQPHVLKESVEAMVIGKASATLKLPDLPPPGADVKLMQSIPPGRVSVAGLFDKIPSTPPATRGPAEPDEPVKLPVGDRGALGWVVLALAVVAIGLVAWLIYHADGSQPATTVVRPTLLPPSPDVAPSTPPEPPPTLPEPGWSDAAADAGATTTVAVGATDGG